MSEIKIVPIFNQEKPCVWGDFLYIRNEATRYSYGFSMSEKDYDLTKKDLVSAWKRRSFNFAFGAYDGCEMVGFINGDCVDRISTIRSLYVLPDYMKHNVGRILLDKAEKISILGSNMIDLVSLPGAQKFYERFNYKPIFYGSNHYIKAINKQYLLRNGVLPVFKVTGVINSAVKEIAAYYGDDLDLLKHTKNYKHIPVYIYMDSMAEIKGACFETESGECKTYVVPRQSEKHVLRKLSQEYNNLKILLAGIKPRAFNLK